MHVADVVDVILSIETRHGLIYLHGAVGSCVANEMIEKLATENVGKKWRQVLFLPCAHIESWVLLPT